MHFLLNKTPCKTVYWNTLNYQIFNTTYLTKSHHKTTSLNYFYCYFNAQPEHNLLYFCQIYICTEDFLTEFAQLKRIPRLHPHVLCVVMVLCDKDTIFVI